jgi:hypothetical protein
MHAMSKAILMLAMLAFTSTIVARGVSADTTDVVLSQGSIRINAVELRTGPRDDDTRYISLAAAERALGHPQDIYAAGLGVHVYAWRNIGVHLQKGWRGPEKDKFFKLQVWFADYYNKAEDKHSGTFKEHVKVEGLEVGPETTLHDIRGQLDKKGFVITTYPYGTGAKKGEITIFTVETSDKIERVEVFITPNQSLEPTAGRRASSLFMTKTLSLQATLALASGGSALAR